MTKKIKRFEYIEYQDGSGESIWYDPSGDVVNTVYSEEEYFRIEKLKNGITKIEILNSNGMLK